MARKFPAWLTLVGIMVLAAAVLVKGQKAAPGDPAGSRLPALRPTGQPQLVSVEPLPGEMGGEMCEWLPASSQERLVAATGADPDTVRIIREQERPAADPRLALLQAADEA